MDRHEAKQLLHMVDRTKHDNAKRLSEVGGCNRKPSLGPCYEQGPECNHKSQLLATTCLGSWVYLTPERPTGPKRKRSEALYPQRGEGMVSWRRTV